MAVRCHFLTLYKYFYVFFLSNAENGLQNKANLMILEGKLYFWRFFSKRALKDFI